MRPAADETLYPNHEFCPRLAELAAQFSKIAAKKWNNTEEMAYVQEKLSKWMPMGERLGVDSHPPLLAVLDAINTTISHGPLTRLPDEFYDDKIRKFVEEVVIEEMYRGYKVFPEFRTLGIGSEAGGIMSRINDYVKWEGNHVSNSQKGGTTGPPEFALFGCHDSTIAALLSSLGCFGSEDAVHEWPGFTSHVAFELWRDGLSCLGPKDIGMSSTGLNIPSNTHLTPDNHSRPIHPHKQMTPKEDNYWSSAEKYYVKLRYNGQALEIPGCKLQGNHLEGDKSMCTLVGL